MALIHRRFMQSCASTAAGAQILGTQCQKEAEAINGWVEECGTPWMARANQTASVWRRAWGALSPKPSPEEINEKLFPLSQTESRFLAPSLGTALFKGI